MSYQQTSIGTLTRVITNDFELFAEVVLNQRNIARNTDLFDSALNQLVDTFYQEFFYSPSLRQLYYLHDVEIFPNDCKIVATTPNVLKYAVNFHNGGGGLDEAIEEAIVMTAASHTPDEF